MPVATTISRRSSGRVNNSSSSSTTITTNIPSPSDSTLETSPGLGPRRKRSTASITHGVTDSIAAQARAQATTGGSPDVGRTSNLKADGSGSIEGQAPAVKSKRGRKAKVLPDAQDTASLEDGSNDDPSLPVKRGRKRKVPSKQTDQGDHTDLSADLSAVSENKQGLDETELDSDGEPVRRSKNGRRLPKKKAKKPKVYVIPDVVKRDFRQEFRPDSTDEFSSQAARSQGFVGRIGYACLNTVLRTADPPIFSSRTARIKSIEEKGLDWVKELARQNCRDILPMLQWNAANNIRFMRLSSEIFPFASHKIYGYNLEFAKEELAEAGRVARSLGHRVTAHPGQFCQLGSPNEDVVAASIKELEVHCAVFDLMGMDQDSVMIIHGGGVYQDRPATLERMRDTIRNKLPENVRNRLVLENDEISWSAEQLLPVCHEFNIPMVFDFHHDMLRPSAKSPRELMPELLGLFKKRGIKPKFHLSHPRPGSRNLRERRAHSDRCLSLPLDLPPDADIMIEAKDKEQAVLELYRIYGLFPVEHSILRPPADDITSATSGRRKTLNGSGGQQNAHSEDENNGVENDDDDVDDGNEEVDGNGDEKKKKRKVMKKPRKPTEKQVETDKIRRTIEHAKKIAAKRGVPYKGPEFLEPGSQAFRLEQGPILSTEETLVIMEEEARLIREELNLRPRGERAVSEIREAIEARLNGVTGDTGQSQEKEIPKREVMQDMTEHTVPGEEEKVIYQPVTPKMMAQDPLSGIQGHGNILTSAENAERIL